LIVYLLRTATKSTTIEYYHNIVPKQLVVEYAGWPQILSPGMGNFCELRIGQCRARKPSFFAKSILEFRLEDRGAPLPLPSPQSCQFLFNCVFMSAFYVCLVAGECFAGCYYGWVCFFGGLLFHSGTPFPHKKKISTNNNNISQVVL